MLTLETYRAARTLQYDPLRAFALALLSLVLSILIPER